MNEIQFKRLTLVLALPLLILGFFIEPNIKFLETVVYYCNIEKESCRFFPRSNERAKYIHSTFNIFENKIVIDDLDYNQIIFNAHIDDPYQKEVQESKLNFGMACYFYDNNSFTCRRQNEWIFGDYFFKSNEYKAKFFNTLQKKSLSTKSTYENFIKFVIAFLTILPLVLFLVLVMIIRFVMNGSLSILNIDFKYYFIRLSIVFLLILVLVNFLIIFPNWV